MCTCPHEHTSAATATAGQQTTAPGFVHLLSPVTRPSLIDNTRARRRTQRLHRAASSSLLPMELELQPCRASQSGPLVHKYRVVRTVRGLQYESEPIIFSHFSVLDSGSADRRNALRVTEL